MVLSILTYRLPKRLTIEEATKAFQSTAPIYLRKRGLLRKHYYITEAGDCVGGVYLWNSKADAEACFTPEWKARVAANDGASPEINYAGVPVTVDDVKEVVEVA